MSEPVSLADLTAADFESHLNTTFEIQLADGNRLSMSLVKVTNSITSPGTHRASFSLRFLGTPGVVLPQRIYRLSHASMGILDIFIVPIGAKPEGTSYEAVFG